MTFEYHPVVADELEGIRDDYEEKSTGLGNSFADAVQDGKINGTSYQASSQGTAVFNRRFWAM